MFYYSFSNSESLVDDHLEPLVICGEKAEQSRPIDQRRRKIVQIFPDGGKVAFIKRHPGNERHPSHNIPCTRTTVNGHVLFMRLAKWRDLFVRERVRSHPEMREFDFFFIIVSMGVYYNNQWKWYHHCMCYSIFPKLNKIVIFLVFYENVILHWWSRSLFHFALLSNIVPRKLNPLLHFPHNIIIDYCHIIFIGHFKLNRHVYSSTY